MNVKLTSIGGQETVWMSSKTFSKLLFLARLHGWTPERQPANWPSSSWNTEVVLQETTDYRQGLVSKFDARGLSEALGKFLALEGAAVDTDLYCATSQFVDVLGRSAFLATEQKTGDTVLFSR